jgi:hypothetical protein
MGNPMSACLFLLVCGNLNSLEKNACGFQMSVPSYSVQMNDD